MIIKRCSPAIVLLPARVFDRAAGEAAIGKADKDQLIV